MKEYCENTLCRNRSIKEVPVSVENPADQLRALCGPCEEAYTWGVQHGTMTTMQEKLAVVAVADRGLIAFVHVYSSQVLAEKALLEYLRKYECYGGPEDIEVVWRWLRNHDERLSVEIVERKVDERPAGCEKGR